MNLQEDPLRPLVELFISGADTATRVVSQAKTTQLATHVGDVLFGVDARVNAGGDGVLFRRKTKAVVSESVENVVALHALEAGEHVRADVSERVANVKASTRGVGEHVENEELFAAGNLFGLGQGASRVGGVVGAFTLPGVLPAGLNTGRQACRVSKWGEVCRSGGGGRRRITHGCAIV